MLRRCCRYGLVCGPAHTPVGPLRPQQWSAERKTSNGRPSQSFVVRLASHHYLLLKPLECS